MEAVLRLTQAPTDFLNKAQLGARFTLALPWLGRSQVTH